ncbi:response regulator transcription factor [Bacillus sp. FJAT-28004]|uniref:response regulator transcription factor n=1 Tax=Bacillus sp. FJAT-28004 TaxID=1679165 RepID=UPI0006B4BA8B|nr:helix-turn-helix domain-containing protein [Bacillus sp. FJAT-28004]
MPKYQAFIVDDEPLARLALREYIALTSTDIEIAGEAGDGEEALNLLRERQDIDIIFADIKMPRMNGVELLAALRDVSFESPPLIVMLSAYGDYGYVRDSFVLGAFDYMLKAKLDEQYIAPVLNKTVEELNKRRRSKAADSVYSGSAAKDEDEIVCSMLHQLSVSDGLNLSHSDQNEELKMGLDIVRKHLGEKNQKVALIRLSHVIHFEHTKQIIMQTIRTVTNTDRNEGICRVCRHDERNYILYFTFPEQCSAMAIRSLTQTVLTDVKIRLRQFLNLNLSIGISDSANGVMQWNRLFRQAERLSLLSYYQGYDHLIYPEAERSVGAEKDNWKEAWTPFKSELLQALKDADQMRWKQSIQHGFKLLLEYFPSSPESIKKALSDLIWEAGTLMHERGMSWDKLHERFPQPVEHVRNMETWDETTEWMHLFLDALHEKLHPKSEKTATWLSPVVAKAKAILDNHFNEDLHLSTICTMVGVSDSYLSKQFAKEIGINFINYLTNLRIEKAKEGLENGLKIYDVAESVGYVNPEHFSRIFKKVTGLSPVSYRKKCEKRPMTASYYLNHS